MINRLKKKNSILLQNIVICPVTIINGYYEIKLKEYPVRYCYIHDKYAIDLDIKCYYDYINKLSYKGLTEILKRRFNEYEKQEILFALNNYEGFYSINNKKEYENTIEDFKNEKLKNGNDYFSSEEYMEKIKETNIITKDDVKQKKLRKKI